MLGICSSIISLNANNGVTCVIFAKRRRVYTRVYVKRWESIKNVRNAFTALEMIQIRV